MGIDNQPIGLVLLKEFPNYGKTADGKFYCFTGKKWVKMRPFVIVNGINRYKFKKGVGTSFRDEDKVQ